MAERYVVCQFCKDTIPFKERVTLTKEVKVISKGKSLNEYWHQECYPKELKKREFNKQEKEQKDLLDATVKKLYKFNFDLPKNWWEFIADLREGTNRYEKFWKKKYKQGVPFNVIKEAYLLSVQDIQWARMSKNFKTSDQELRYGLMIMQGKVNDAYRKMKTREQQEKINEAMEKVHIEDMQDNREVSFQSVQKEKKDYRKLLGND